MDRNTINPNLASFGFMLVNNSAPLFGSVSEEKPDLTQANKALDAAKARVINTQKTETKKVESKETERKPLTSEAIYNLNNYLLQTLSPDQKLIAYKEIPGFKLCILDAQTKKPVNEKLLKKINAAQGFEFVNFSKDSEHLVFAKKDKNGKIKFYSINIKTGKEKTIAELPASTLITKYDQDKNIIYFLHFDPTSIVSAKKPGPGQQDPCFETKPDKFAHKLISKIYLGGENTGKSEVIYEHFKRDDKIGDFLVSPDERYLAVHAYCETNNKQEISLWDTKNRKMHKITDNLKGESLCGWDPNSKYLFFLKDSKSNNSHSQKELYAFDIKTLYSPENKYKTCMEDTAMCLTKEMDINIEQVIMPKNKPYIYFISQSGFYNQIYGLDLNKISEKPQIIIKKNDSSFVDNEMGALVSNDGNTLYFIEDTPDAPKALTSFDTISSKRKEILSQNKNFYQKYEIPKQEIKSFEYENTDENKKITIEYSITYPSYYKENDGKKYPLILLAHGGPWSRFSADFLMFEQPRLLAAQGYVVVAPNIRGSTGYGETHVEDINRDKPGNNMYSKGYRDFMAVTDHIISNCKGKIDETKLGIWGFSYGGTIVNYIITQTNRFAAAVSGAGISNQFTFRESPEGFNNLIFSSDKPYEYYNEAAKYSPIAQNLKNVTTPIVLIHGEKDRKVLYDESVNFYNALIAEKKDARLINYKKAGHSYNPLKDGFIAHHNYVINSFNHHFQPQKEIYTTENYIILSHDGKIELKNMVLIQTKIVDNKKPKGKFVLVNFTLDAINSFKTNFELTDEKGNIYKPAGQLINGKMAQFENKTLYPYKPMTFTLVFDISKTAKELIFKAEGFPNVKI